MMTHEDKEWIIDTFFRLKSFEDLWFDIKQTYENMGFTDRIPDTEKIEEYTYISKQFRKYVSTKQDIVLAKDTVSDMALVVEDLISKADEYAATRKELVYNVLRDHWLLWVYESFLHLANFEDEDEEEE